MFNKKNFTWLIVLIFLTGNIDIIYRGRPVYKLQQKVAEQNNQTGELSSKIFSVDTVKTHNQKNDCWAIIEENVYDLTSWVSRHPGGAKAIIYLCGQDGSAKFEKQHGNSGAAKTTLALLKIGTTK